MAPSNGVIGAVLSVILGEPESRQNATDYGCRPGDQANDQRRRGRVADNHRFMSAAPVRIVLCMIVRNEASVIERCLDCALPHVDGYVVSDTGSSDATTDLIERTAARHGVPGSIRRHEWHHFGHNRTLSAE